MNKKDEPKVESLVAANRHLSALHMQHLVWNTFLILVPVGKLQTMLEKARAEAHQSGAVIPR